MTAARGQDCVDFEDGVWIHRLTDGPGGSPAPEGIPEPIWRRSAAAAAAIAGVAAKRPVACAYAPIWDCEGAAILADGRWPLVVGLQTPLKVWLDSQPDKSGDPVFMRDFAGPMLALETRLLRQADGIHGISRAIVRDIERLYGVALDDERLAVIPLGLEDWRDLPAVAPPAGAADGLRILFVGRLERRKGIDVLLDAARPLLARHATLSIDIVGNDAIPAPDGVPYRTGFERDPTAAPIRRRIAFHGEVDEARLRGFYQACDVVVAPSRFESFGLVAVEAMMAGKPVVGSRTGGMIEVIEDGVTGLLAAPGDVRSLEHCLERLVLDVDLRRRLGAAGRRRYETLFRPDAMVRLLVDFMAERADARAGRPVAAMAAQ